MKVRFSFVANSSASSFIIGLANIGNINLPLAYKFDASLINWERNQWQEPSYIFKPSTNSKNNESIEVNVNILEDGETYKLSIESFDGTTVYCNVKDGDYILVINSVGPDDDYFFITDSGYLDYDIISLDDFDKDDQELYELIKKYDGEAIYGAGRNG